MVIDFTQLQKVDTGVYIKKGNLFKYRLVYPIQNEDGSTNWHNLLTGGDYGKLIMTLVICLLLIGSVFAYKHDIQSCADTLNKIVKNPCELCNAYTSGHPTQNFPPINFTAWDNLINKSEDLTT